MSVCVEGLIKNDFYDIENMQRYDKYLNNPRNLRDFYLFSTIIVYSACAMLFTYGQKNT